VEQISTLQPVEDLHWSRWVCYEGICSLRRGAHAGASFLAGTMAHGGPTMEQSIPEGLYPAESTHAGAVHEELHPVGGKSMPEQRKSMRRKERQRQRVMN